MLGACGAVDGKQLEKAASVGTSGTVGETAGGVALLRKSSKPLDASNFVVVFVS